MECTRSSGFFIEKKATLHHFRKSTYIPELLEEGGSMIPVLSANSCIVRPAYPMTLLQELQAYSRPGAIPDFGPGPSQRPL